MGVQRHLITARFFFTIGHLTAQLLLFQIIGSIELNYLLTSYFFLLTSSSSSSSLTLVVSRLFFPIDNNINLSLGDSPSETEKFEAQRTANVRIRRLCVYRTFLPLIHPNHYWLHQAALAFGCACFLFDFGGLFLGSSIFYNTVFAVLFHTIPIISKILAFTHLHSPTHLTLLTLRTFLGLKGKHGPDSLPLPRQHIIKLAHHRNLELQSSLANR